MLPVVWSRRRNDWDSNMSTDLRQLACRPERNSAALWPAARLKARQWHDIGPTKVMLCGLGLQSGSHTDQALETGTVAMQ